MSEPKFRHEWSEKSFHFGIANDGVLWFRDESQGDEWWIADTSGACDMEMLAEILRLRGLLQEAWYYIDLDCAAVVAVDDLKDRIRQALHQEGE